MTDVPPPAPRDGRSTPRPATPRPATPRPEPPLPGPASGSFRKPDGGPPPSGSFRKPEAPRATGSQAVRKPDGARTTSSRAAAEEDAGAQAARAELALASALSTAMRVARLHALDNKVTAEAIVELRRALEEHLGQRGRAVLLVADERLYVDGRALRPPRSAGGWLDELVQALGQAQVGALLFGGTWDDGAVRALLAGLAPGQATAGELSRAARAVPPPARLEVLDPTAALAFASEEQEGRLPPRALARFHHARLRAIADALRRSARKGAPELYAHPARQTIARLVELLRSPALEQGLLACTVADPGDEDGAAIHAANVTILSVAMGRLLGLTLTELASLGTAALLHDAGLDAQEPSAELDATHLARGVARCLRARAVSEASLLRLAVVAEHHAAEFAETGLREPHPLSSVVGVADHFDRLQAALGCPTRALAALRDPPAAHPPAAIALLEDVLGPVPRGSIVRLEDGAPGVIIDGGARRNRPIALPLAPGADALRELAAADVEVIGGQSIGIDWRAALLGPYPERLHLRPTGASLQDLIGLARQAIGGATDTPPPGASPADSAVRDMQGVVLADDGERGYVIRRELGRGGQGVVFEVDVQGEPFADASAVVMKVAAPSGREALTRERDVYAVADPGLVRMLDAGTASQEAFLILERLEPLPDRCDPALALDLFLSLLGTLHALHFHRERPLVLCDVKPANVMLRARRGPGSREPVAELAARGLLRPVFTDVGCAVDRRVLEARDGRLDALVGTPLYLPPESAPLLLQDEVLLGRYSRLTDVYALTLSLHELIAGERPYARTGLFDLSGRELLAELFAMKRERVSPIARERIAALVGDEADAVLEVLDAGLAPDPARRPSAQGLLRLCRRALDVEDVACAATCALPYRQRRVAPRT